MKKTAVTFSILVLFSMHVSAQDSSASTEKNWAFNAAGNFYFIPDDFFIMPMLKADKNRLHLEARYNYEDRETFSGWIGYNLSGGKKLEYTITPMIGGVVGLSNGIAPGLEFTLTLNRFELYNESEYFVDFNTNENNFFYSWVDFTYAPADWLWLGISGQRTRLYQTDLDLQRGLLVGGGFKSWELTTYVYNIGLENPFVLLTLSATF